jgi:hypothetical protein
MAEQNPDEFAADDRVPLDDTFDRENGMSIRRRCATQSSARSSSVMSSRSVGQRLHAERDA